MQLAKQLCFTIPGLTTPSVASVTVARPGTAAASTAADICAFRTRSAPLARKRAVPKALPGGDGLTGSGSHVSDAGGYKGSPGALHDDSGKYDVAYYGVGGATSPPNVTSEPSSLFLMETGAFALAAMLRRTTLAFPN